MTEILQPDLNPAKSESEDHDFIDVLDTEHHHHYIDLHGNEHILETEMYPYTIYFLTDDKRTMMRDIHTAPGEFKREWLGYTHPRMKFGQYAGRNYQKELEDFIVEQQLNAEKSSR